MMGELVVEVEKGNCGCGKCVWKLFTGEPSSRLGFVIGGDGEDDGIIFNTSFVVFFLFVVSRDSK